MRVTVIGAGVAGLVTAIELAGRGARVEIVERAPSLGTQACAWVAGGMLAPWCEQATTEPRVAALGAASIAWWQRHFADTVQRGTLVVAASRDAGELDLFGRRTDRFEAVDDAAIGALEPDLAGRFRRGLFFPHEAHLDPRRALPALAAQLDAMGVPIRHGVNADVEQVVADRVVDCRGIAARDTLEDLRGVRGEMVMLRAPDIHLTRPVRLLHPRFGVYVIPRGRGVFMLGGSLLESGSHGPVTVRSAMDLLNAAYALHPAFAEAQILELGVGVRPAFPDNLPRVVRRGNVIHLNGLYRHGFLLSPAMAQQAADVALANFPEASACTSS
jgi:glycine oxidase